MRTIKIVPRGYDRPSEKLDPSGPKEATIAYSK